MSSLKIKDRNIILFLRIFVLTCLFLPVVCEHCLDFRLVWTWLWALNATSSIVVMQTPKIWLALPWFYIYTHIYLYIHTYICVYVYMYICIKVNCRVLATKGNGKTIIYILAPNSLKLSMWLKICVGSFVTKILCRVVIIFLPRYMTSKTPHPEIS